MAGAMRKMGIYLGLVEDDDARAYGRYDARQADSHDRYDGPGYDEGRYDERYDGPGYDEGRYDDRRAGRYDDRHDVRPDSRYDDRRPADARGDAGYGGYDSLAGDAGYGDRYGDRRYDGERFDDRGGREDLPADPEPALPRRNGATRLGLATPVSSASIPSPASSPSPVAGAGESRVSAPAGTAGPRLGTVGSAGGITAGGAGGGVTAGAVGAAAGLAAREAVAAAEPAPTPAPQPYRITTLSPKTYNEARAIGEAFRDGSPVIMNLTELDHADARRLVDFAAGLIFGLRGNIEPVTAKVFLLSPRDVDVTAEDKARIREGGFFAGS
jgi:cell division inhibitor SepF